MYESDQIKRDCPYLKNIEFPVPHNSDVTLLIGADSPSLLVHETYVAGSSNQPIAVKTKLGWMLLGGKSSKSSVVTNYLEKLQPRYLKTLNVFGKLNRTVRCQRGTRATYH